MSDLTPDETRVAVQYGALCYRFTKRDKLRVLLITSRGIGRWVVPKGWPMRGRTAWETALTEAWEEAGVRGHVSRNCLGSYDYDKWYPEAPLRRCRVRLFPVEVVDLADNFPEAGQRQRKWVSPKQAAEDVNETDLAQVLLSFSP